ncbi:alpha/beta hydrolase [Microbacteriaceae bacterium K1510]|nr:alpha/beta hydrolase [Microbacteriaceae bacterium K1510]
MSSVGRLPDVRLLTVDGRHVVWREAGSGVPLVLVHGIGGHSGSWANQFSSFARTHRVIAWDAPGYGGSDPLPPDSLSAQAYAASLRGLLNALGVSEPHLVGHSLGAIIISVASRENALRPRSLTLLQPVTGSGTMDPEQREKIHQQRASEMKRLGPIGFAVERGRQILSRATPSAVADEAVDVMKAVPESGYLAAWEMMCAADIFSVLNQNYPTQVICGSDDPVSPPATGKAIADRIPDAMFVCLDHVGHYAAIEAPELLEAHLRPFVESHQ